MLPNGGLLLGNWKDGRLTEVLDGWQVHWDTIKKELGFTKCFCE